MPRICRVLRWSVLAAFFVSCRSESAIDIVESPFPDAERDIERTLQAILRAAEEKDFDTLERYHLYGPKFTKFPESGARQDAATARAAERNGIGALVAFRPAVEELKVDVFGRVAVATFLMPYEVVTSDDTLSESPRSTMVFVKDGPDWKIAHEHFSPLEPKS